MGKDSVEKSLIALFAAIVIALAACLAILISFHQSKGVTEATGMVIFTDQTGPHIIRYDTTISTSKN